MKKVLTLFLAVLVVSTLASTNLQAERVTATRPNAVSFEGLGRGILYSLNYDRSFTENIGAGLGFGFLSLAGVSVLIFPVYGNYYFFPFATEEHHLFATGGITVVYASATADSFSVSASGVGGSVGGGYEYRSNGGFLFRAAPYILIGTGGALPWFGLSAGYAF